jgi:hypothetical protein
MSGAYGTSFVTSAFSFAFLVHPIGVSLTAKSSLFYSARDGVPHAS